MAKKLSAAGRLMEDIPRGVTARYARQQTVPQARWQDARDITGNPVLTYDPKRPGKKVLIGALGEELIGIEDNRHILTVAGSRAGKSVTLTSNLYFYPGSALATDPKGELANLTAARRAKMGQKICVLDPFQICDASAAEFRVSYNPMAMLHPESPTLIEDSELIADAMVIGGGSDPHWDESAKNFLQGLILYVAVSPDFAHEKHLISVKALLDAALMTEEDGEETYNPLLADLMRLSARLMREPATADVGSAIRGATLDFYDKADRERASVLSTARRHARFLDYASLRRTLRGSDFDLKELKSAQSGMSIYLCLPAVRMGMCARWLRIFINQLLHAMEAERTAPAAPVLVCLDEFPVLGHMKQLEDAIGQIASFDVKLWTVLQDWNQGQALYKARWETFAGNAGILQFFGNNDLTTTEYIARRLGKTRVSVSREGEVSQEQKQKGLRGQSEGTELFDLMTPEEIGRYFARSDSEKRQLVIWAGYNPMIIQRVEYFDKSAPYASWFAAVAGS